MAMALYLVCSLLSVLSSSHLFRRSQDPYKGSACSHSRPSGFRRPVGGGLVISILEVDCERLATAVSCAGVQVTISVVVVVFTMLDIVTPAPDTRIISICMVRIVLAPPCSRGGWRDCLPVSALCRYYRV